MKIRRLLCCLLLVTVLAGCTGQNKNIDTTEATEESTLSPETTSPTEPEEITLEAVNTLTYKASSQRPEVSVLDERTAAFLTVESVKGDYQKKTTTIQVWDLYTDTMTAECTMDGAYAIMDLSSGENVVLVDTENTVLVLDRNLEELCRFACEDSTGVLTADLGTYYYLWGNSLYKLDTATGEAVPSMIAADLPLSEIQSYDAQENVLLMTAFVDPYTTATCMYGVDLDDGNTVLLMDNVTGGQMAEDGVCLQNYNKDGMYSDVKYLDWEEAALRSLPEFMPNDGTYSTWHISGSDYICQVTFDAVQKDKAVASDLYRLGETVAMCPLQELLDNAKINEILALPDGNLLALEVTRRGYTPYLICPEMLTFTEVSTPETAATPLVDVTIAENYAAELNCQVPEKFAGLRQMADEIEESFGVTVLLSNQCSVPVTGADMTITTTDQAGLSNETGHIENALRNLRKLLALYPKDFFRQFQNEAGERGLLILLVEDFEDNRNVIGLCYQMGEWYTVAVDITSGTPYTTFAHEIWHATENKITSVNTDLLSNEKWDTCNPSGYVYSYDGSADYVHDVENTFFHEHNKNEVYFVDAYGKTNPYEDRARIMEYIMTSAPYAREMAEAPALRLKLKIMSDAIREVFDTEQWEKPHWERFF